MINNLIRIVMSLMLEMLVKIRQSSSNQAFPTVHNSKIILQTIGIKIQREAIKRKKMLQVFILGRVHTPFKKDQLTCHLKIIVKKVLTMTKRKSKELPHKIQLLMNLKLLRKMINPCLWQLYLQCHH